MCNKVMKSPFLFLVNHMDNLKLISSVFVSLFVSFLIIFFKVTVTPSGVLFETMNILLLPAAPIIYGWITRNKIGSIVVGTVPYIGFLLYLTHISGELYDIDVIQFIKGIFSLVIISIVGGLEGYYASKGIKEGLKLAILLGVAWMLLFIRGID